MGSREFPVHADGSSAPPAAAGISRTPGAPPFVNSTPRRFEGDAQSFVRLFRNPCAGACHCASMPLSEGGSQAQVIHAFLHRRAWPRRHPKKP